MRDGRDAGAGGSDAAYSLGFEDDRNGSRSGRGAARVAPWLAVAVCAAVAMSMAALGMAVVLLSDHESLAAQQLAQARDVAPDVRVTVAQRIEAYFNALDLRTWDAAMDFFEPTYYSNYNIEGAKPQMLDRTINWLVWPCFLAGFNSTHHQLGNVVVTLDDVGDAGGGDGDERPMPDASVVLKGTATHNYESELWQTAGIYRMKLRVNGGGGDVSIGDGLYRLYNISYTQHWAVGDEATLSLLARNAAWDENAAFCTAHGGHKPPPPPPPPLT
jgi:hypothetical protein